MPQYKMPKNRKRRISLLDKYTKRASGAGYSDARLIATVGLMLAVTIVGFGLFITTYETIAKSGTSNGVALVLTGFGIFTGSGALKFGSQVQETKQSNGSQDINVVEELKR